MFVFSLVNQKGGVGKTTTAVNLATAIAACGKKTLLIDLDSQGNATTAFGLTSEQRSPSSYDVIVENSLLDEAIKPTAIPYLYICPASVDLAGTDVMLSTRIGREHILRKRIEALKEHFDYVFLDCPPSLGLLTINALTASDFVLIPLQCEFYSLEGLSYLLNTVDLVQQNLNEKLDIGGILLTMYDRRNKLTNEVESEVRKHFKDVVFDTMIPRNVKLSEAPSHGQPGIIYDHRCTGSKAYMLLAREVLNRFPTHEILKKAS
jgi:chromosome partitioning protein